MAGGDYRRVVLVVEGGRAKVDQLDARVFHSLDVFLLRVNEAAHMEEDRKRHKESERSQVSLKAFPRHPSSS